MWLLVANLVLNALAFVLADFRTEHRELSLVRPYFGTFYSRLGVSRMRQPFIGVFELIATIYRVEEPELLNKILKF